MALTLCHLGHVATTAELLASVHGQDSVVDIYQSVREIVRCRRGLYACAHLSVDELTALRCGGLLDCVSALNRAGLGLYDDGCVHVRFHPEKSRARPHPELSPRPIVSHWARMLTWRTSTSSNHVAHIYRRAVETRAHVPIEEAFRQALTCVAPSRLTELIAGVTLLLPQNVVTRIVSDSSRRTRERIMRSPMASD